MKKAFLLTVFSLVLANADANLYHNPKNTATLLLDANGKVTDIYKISSYSLIEPLSFELGISYTASSFLGIQRAFVINGGFNEMANTSHIASGAELTYGVNYYIARNFGISLFGGTEFLPLRWKDKLVAINEKAQLEAQKTNLLSTYLGLSSFVDLWQGESKALRVFGGVGLSENFLFGGSYEQDTTCNAPINASSCDIKSKTKYPLNAFYIVGMRFFFFKHSAIELASKFNLLEWEFEQRILNTKESIATKISRKAGFSLRYVYEFK